MNNKYNEYLTKFKNSNTFDIYQAYRKPSSRKVVAFYSLINRNAKIDIDLSIRIIGHNCSYFTLATYIPAIDIIIIDTYANTYIYNREYGKISWNIMLNMIDDYRVNRY